MKQIISQIIKPQKLLLLTLISVFLLLNLTACKPAALGKQDSQLVQAILSDPKTFNAALSQEIPNVFGLIYEGLIFENPITGETEPALAKSWQFSEDKQRITFTLREGLKWSDGQPLTAEDVDFSYNQIYLNEEIPSNVRDSLRVGRSGTLPTVKKLDNLTIEFSISEPFAPFLRSTGLSILPAHILRSKVENKDENGKPVFLSTWGIDTPPEEIIVNGPYKLDQYFTSERVKFAANPYYWRKDSQGKQLPYIKEIVWSIVESTDTSLLQFRSGSLDSIGVSPEYFSLLKREEKPGNFTIYNGGPAYGLMFMAFNQNQGKRNGKPLIEPYKSRWFNNVNFRKAIAYGIDRQRMINNIYQGLGQTQNSQISVQSPYYYSEVKTYDYNLELAKKLLLQEGFKYDEEGKLLDAENNPVRFSLLTNAGNKIREQLGSQIKEDLSKLGIQVDFTPIAFGVLVNKLTQTLDWDAHIIGFGGGNEPHGSVNLWYPDGNLHLFNQKPQAGSPPIEGRVVMDWEEQMAEYYIQAAKELDEEKRKAIYAKAQILGQEYLPLIYLVNPLSLGAVRNRFQGIEYSALGGAFWNVERLEITE